MPPITALDRDLIGFGWVGNLFDVLVSLLLVAALVTAIIVGITMLRQRRSGAPIAVASTGSATSAVLLLDERFAKGDIDEDDYRSRRALLTGDQA